MANYFMSFYLESSTGKKPYGHENLVFKYDKIKNDSDVVDIEKRASDIFTHLHTTGLRAHLTFYKKLEEE